MTCDMADMSCNMTCDMSCDMADISCDITCDMASQDIVRFNVCGMIYETMKSTLEKFPDTLLGNRKKRERFFVPLKNACFFDRHRACFEAVLNFHRSGGILLKPEEVSKELFEEELAFYGLQQSIDADFNHKDVFQSEPIDSEIKSWQKDIWELFEVPESSIWARIVGIFSVFVIALSIMVSCMETMPMFHDEDHHDELVKITNMTHIEPWYSLELGCIVCFAVEYILRFIASPNKCRFVLTFLNMVDLAAFLPYFILLGFDDKLVPLPHSILKIARLARIMQMFKLYRYSIRLRILGRTMILSQRELYLMVFFLAMGLILFASAFYYAEKDDNDAIGSIPDAFYYIMVTMTTVGYGSVVPVTLLGKLIGSGCAITGVLALALPVPVIVSNFNYLYQHKSRNNRRKGGRNDATKSTHQSSC